MNLIDTEPQQKSQVSELRELRIFAFALCIFVFLIFTIKIPWLTGYRPSIIYPIIINVFVLLLALIKPHVFAPLSKSWRSIAKVVGGFLAFLALGFIFYLVMTPTAILARILKYNPLCLRLFRSNKKGSFYKLDCQSGLQNDLQNLF